MIQGGDPKGDGTGGPGFAFDDEFHADLQFTSKGVLAMANSGDDSSGSQFFITAVPKRELDFDYSIFGLLTEGESVRQSIASVLVDGETPREKVVMSSVEIFTDTENGVLMLSAAEGTSGTAKVTVTVNDGTSTAEQSFKVTFEPDTSDSNPFLLPVADVYTTVNTSASFTLSAVDVEGDSLYYDGIVDPANENLTLEVNTDTGQATVTPKGGLTGVHGLLVGVRQADGNTWDTQEVPVFIKPVAPASVELLAGSDTGASNSDRITRLNNTAGNTLQFRVSGVAGGVAVRVLADGTQIGQATAAGDSVVITTDGSHALSQGNHSITAVRVLLDQQFEIGNRHETVDLEGLPSPILPITVDAAAAQFTSIPVVTADEGQAYAYDVQTDDETLGLAVSYRLTTSPAGMLIDQGSGEINWAPQSGQGPTEHVVVVATDRAGNEASQGFDVTIEAEPLPQVDFWELRDQAAEDGYRYAFRAVRDGRLTVEALFSHAAGDVDLTLLNSQGAKILSSTSQTDNERIDLLVHAGRKYEFVIAGNNPQTTYRVTNLVVDRPNKVEVHGTAGDDTFEAIAGASPRATVNGVRYNVFDPIAGREFVIDGRGGNDNGRVVGTPADEQATLSPGSAALVGPDYRIALANVSSITIEGVDGHDVANFADSPGDDEFAATYRGATLSGDGFSSQVKLFAEVYVDASAGGSDTAKVFDSPGDDTYVTLPTFAGLFGDGFRIEMRRFQAVHSYGVGGGIDTAKMYDSPGDDTLCGTPTETALYGEGFYNRVKDYEAVHSFASAGGTDVARLYDSPGNDKFFGGPVEGALFGAGFYNRAKLFEQLEAHADAGGEDTAELYDSPADDLFEVSPGHGKMSGEGFSIEVGSFAAICGFANAGGTDLAKMYDSPGDDTFHGSPTGGQLAGDGFTNRARSFERMEVDASAGGLDVAKLYDTPGDDTFVASPGHGELSAGGSSVQVDGFFAVHAYATAGGSDAAELHDSPGDDTFNASPDEAALFGDGFYSRAKSFENVRAIADDDGEDLALLYDSPSNDKFTGTPTSCTLSNDILEKGFSNRADFFEDVRAYATAGGLESAILNDSPGDDTLVVMRRFARMFGDGYSVRAESFASIQANADAGGADLAKIFDSPGDDTFRGTTTRAECYGADFLNVVNGYEYVHAYSTAGGHDVAHLLDSPEKDKFVSTFEDGALFGAGFYNRAKHFEEVYATATEGDDEAFLGDSDLVDLLEAEDDWARLSNEALDFLYQAKGFDYVKATATTEGDTMDTAPLSELLFTLEPEGPWQEP